MNSIDSLRSIPCDYFSRSTLEVARELLGAYIVRTVEGERRLVARIVETEAYTGDDPACHGWRLKQKSSNGEIPEGKGSELFGPPGHAYVYLCYGVHWLFNVVTEPEGTCGAVLVRAVEPVEGLDQMRQHRSSPGRDVDLTNGPGKLTQALAIDDRFHEQLLDGPDLYLTPGETPPASAVTTTPRIGISKATDRPWRFLLRDNPYVSAP